MRRGCTRIEGIDDFLDDLGLGIGTAGGPGIGSEMQASFPEPGLLQVFENDFARDAFLCDEKNAFALRHEVGGDVRDCLAFAGARRAFDDETGAGGSEGHRLELIGIGFDDGAECAGLVSGINRICRGFERR